MTDMRACWFLASSSALFAHLRESPSIFLTLLTHLTSYTCFGVADHRLSVAMTTITANTTNPTLPTSHQLFQLLLLVLLPRSVTCALVITRSFSPTFTKQWEFRDLSYCLLLHLIGYSPLVSSTLSTSLTYLPFTNLTYLLRCQHIREP